MTFKYYFVGRINSDWNTSGNWSNKSGGKAVKGVPELRCMAMFDGSSPDCIRKGRFVPTCSGVTIEQSFKNKLSVIDGVLNMSVIDCSDKIIFDGILVNLFRWILRKLKIGDN